MVGQSWLEMAIGNKHERSPDVERRSFGTFKITGHGYHRHLTITSDLDDYDFPREIGSEVRVELVDEPDRPNYLEVHPANGGD